MELHFRSEEESWVRDQKYSEVTTAEYIQKDSDVVVARCAAGLSSKKFALHYI